jgi:small subunit ribosomal protein S5
MANEPVTGGRVGEGGAPSGGGGRRDGGGGGGGRRDGGRRDGRDGPDSRESGMVDFLVKIRRSACVVKGGRRFSFNALVVVGDKSGRVSFGYAKANEVPPAVEKAIKEGEANTRRSKRVQLKGKTIPHRVIGRFGASRVILVPAGPGTGVKAGPGVREVLQAAGIENILSKTHGSTNPINLVKATIDGLQQLRTREEVARLRGVQI